MNLGHFRQLLLAERKQYEDQITMIAETGLGHLSQGDQNQEDSTVDNHPADLGSEMFEREKDLGLRSNATRRLRQIDIALERMAAHTYGTCEACGGPVAEERLEVNPSATTCMQCQQERESLPDPFHRPIEEQVLNPPFGRTFRDGSGDPGYDGEDAWQEVGSYGTSETIQDVPGARDINDLYNSDEDVYTVVDPMDALVDEDGEPLQQDERDEDNQTQRAGDLSNTLYGPDDMGGNFQWKPGPEHHTVMPERQFRRGKFSR